MQFRRTVGVLAIVAGTAGSLFSGVAPASAATPKPSIQSVKTYVTVSPANPNVAYVQATYTCHGGAAANHLWVSVKQGHPGVDLSVEGSSSLATAWYDSHPANLTCNGKPATTVFTINRHLDKGILANGSGYLQFCLFPVDNFDNIVIKNQTVTVVRPGSTGS